MFETVRYETEGDVVFIVLNRPEALNALSLQLTRDLTAAITRAAEENVRCVVLSGEGRAFCSGGDLREMQSMWKQEGRIEAFLEEPLKALHEMIILIRETPIPFLGSINGVCAGAGTNIALACDLLIASEEAVFNEAFVKIGLSPDCGGTFFLPRAVGEKRAAEMFMLGETINAETAKELGLINRVVPAEFLVDETKTLAQKLAAAPTGSLGRIKVMLNASSSNDLRSQLELEHKLQIESGRSADFKEGVSAFFEKRAAAFSGS